MGDIRFQKRIVYNTPCTVPKLGLESISHKGKNNESHRAQDPIENWVWVIFLSQQTGLQDSYSM